MDKHLIINDFDETLISNVGDKLSDFEILTTIGKGGYGFVVKVRSKRDHKIYAMKMIDFNKLKTEDEKNDIWHEKELEKIYREMKRTGAVMISDEEYSDYLIEEIIKTAKKNNTYDQLPEIIIYIDKRLKEEENEKDE